MNPHDQIKDRLRSLLSDDGFSVDNLAAIEEVCNKYFETSTSSASHAGRDVGFYLLLSLAEEIRQRLEGEQALTTNRHSSIRERIWPQFQALGRAVLNDEGADELLRVSQQAIHGVFLLM